MPKLSEEQKIEKYNHLVMVAKSKGGLPLFDKWPGAKTKVSWKCSCGCEWQATPNNIQTGTWCPNCSSGLSERICRDLFEKLFDGINSTIPKGQGAVNHPFECLLGHRWFGRADQIKNTKQWCPECAKNKNSNVISK